MAAALLSCSLPAPAAWKSEDIDTSFGDRGQWLVSALDPAKRLHVAYRSGTGRLFHARWDGIKWIKSQVDQGLDDGLVKNLGIGLAVDKNGDAHISYYDNGNIYDKDGYFVTYRANLKYAKWNGSGWTKQTVVTDHDAGEFNSLAIDSSGHPHICYFYQNLSGADAWFGKLEYVSWNGNAWVRELVDDAGSGSGGESGEHCQLVMDDTDTPQIIYRSVTESNYVINEHLRYAVRNSSGGWAIEPVTLDQDNWGASLALAPDGTPHVAIYDSDSASLRYLTRTTGGWTGSIIDSDYGAGMYQSVAVDSNGVPSVAYADEGYKLIIARKSGSSWLRSTVSGNVTLGVASQFGPGDSPLVAYYHPGTGLLLAKPAAPEIEVRQPATSNLTDGVSKKSFGTVSLGSSKSKTFTIRNTGNLNLKNLAISKNGANVKDFTISQPTSTTLAPGATTTFKITFKPASKGTRNAAIHITSNDGDENPFDIQLAGSGAAP